jgi:competence protein ComEC
MSKSKIFFLLSLAFIGGIFLSSFYYPKNISNLSLLVLIITAVIIISTFYENKLAVMVGFFIIFLVFGIFWENISLNQINNHDEGKSFSGLVRVTKEPQIRNRYQNLIVEQWKSEALFGYLMSNHGKFLVSTRIYPEYEYGDMLKVDCKLEMAKNVDDGSNFDYRMYLAKDAILYTCQNPNIEKTGENQGNKFYAGIIKVKNKFNETIAALMPSPESGLLSGLLIGGSGRMSKEYQDAFSRTGTTHIVAISGYNVAIVAEYLMLLGIFIGLWRRQAFWFATMGIILFVILTGLPSSAVRAGVMGILLIWAMKNGRLANSKNAIIFAAAVMLLVNPMLFRWDVGFQLSFLATLGIIYIYPLFQNYFVKKYKAFGITELLFLTISAQIFVFPILFINFQKLSLISPLANILVLPIIPLTMLLGFIAIAFNFIFLPVAQVFSWLAFLLLKYETMTIKYLASLKYASFEIIYFPWWGVAAWYIILVGGIVIIKRKIKEEITSSQ